jgi:hypothetical protein
MVGASVAGTSHAGSGHPCADACVVRVLPRSRGRSLLIAVVADGAGTSEHAPKGSRLACEAILERAEAWGRGAKGRNSHGLSTFTRKDVLDWVETARRRIARTAESRSLQAVDFSCTLLVALVDEASAVFFQVGDGAIVYRGEDGQYVPALWPQSGEYANCTWFVTDDDVANRVQLAKARGVHEVALFSDGLQALALRFASREAHAPFFEPMFARLRQEPEGPSASLLPELRAFLDSRPVNSRTDDDKTLVLATRLRAGPVGKGGARART